MSCLIAGAIALAVSVGLTALASGFGHLALPDPLVAVDLRLPGIFRLHMVASGLALVLLPAAILTRHRSNVHRVIGRGAAGLLVVGALASLPSALASEALPLARLGFFTQGLLCLTFLLLAWRAIRTGRRRRHATFMVRVSALVAGVIVLRIMTVLIVRAELPFDAAYAIAAWTSWLVPLAAVWAWQSRAQATA